MKKGERLENKPKKDSQHPEQNREPFKKFQGEGWDFKNKKSGPNKRSAVALKINKEDDWKTTIIPSLPEGKKEVDNISIEVVKNSYVVDSLTDKEIAKKFSIPLPTVQAIIKTGKLQHLREILIRDGLAKIQNKHLRHATELLDIEAGFHELQQIKLKASLEDHAAYLAYYGDLYLRDKEGEILLNENGIPLQIKIPNVARDIRDIKGSIVLGEGLKRVMKEVGKVLEGKPVSQAELDMEEIFKEAKVVPIIEDEEEE